MQYRKPTQFLTKSEFVLKCVETIFYTMDNNRTNYGYREACAKEIDKRAEIFKTAKGKTTKLILAFSYEIAKLENMIKESGRKNPVWTRTLLEDTADKYLDVIDSLGTASTIKGWLDNEDNICTFKSGTIPGASVLFAMLMLLRDEFQYTGAEFVETMLGVLGIHEPGEIIFEMLKHPSMEIAEKKAADGSTIYELTDKGVRMLLAMICVQCHRVGASEEIANELVDGFHTYFGQVFEEEISAGTTIHLAQKRLYECIRFFEPRSITSSVGRLSPQEFFVLPRFESGCNPFSLVNESKKGRRLIVKAKTGQGKSTYLKMGALCSMRNAFSGDAAEKLSDIAEEMGIADDMLVLFIPARMFTYCFAKKREWTQELDRLFFEAMWKLCPNNNFFMEMGGLQTGLEDGHEAEGNRAVFSDTIKKYLHTMAKRGKLVLVLDSFDEIAAGVTRISYINSLQTFVETYCELDNSEAVGAHIILTTRELSDSTMSQVESAMYIGEDDIVGMQGLDRQQRAIMVENWKRVNKDMPDDLEWMLNTIEENRYYREYAENPYLFSILCFFFANEMKDIVDQYIKTLVDKMCTNNRNANLRTHFKANLVITEIMQSITKIMQSIAVETVKKGENLIPRETIRRYVGEVCAHLETSLEEIDSYLERIHEIFAVEVGLIVPADGHDEDYQFINEQVRYHLAAQGIAAGAKYDDLNEIKTVKDYVGTMVPLITMLNDDVQLEKLIADYTMREFASAEEDQWLVQGLLDLFLRRYGDNNLSPKKMGTGVAKYEKRAGREAILRLLASKAFDPTEKEKEDLMETSAYKDAAAWIKDCLLLS